MSWLFSQHFSLLRFQRSVLVVMKFTLSVSFVALCATVNAVSPDLHNRATDGYVQNPSGSASFTQYTGCSQPGNLYNPLHPLPVTMYTNLTPPSFLISIQPAVSPPQATPPPSPNSPSVPPLVTAQATPAVVVLPSRGLQTPTLLRSPVRSARAWS